jgi:hypothetical protein
MKNQTPLSDGLSVSTFLVSKTINPDKLVISRKDQETLRRLAGQVAQLAARPIENEKRDLWFRHNALEATRPLYICGERLGNARNESWWPKRRRLYLGFAFKIL